MLLKAQNIPETHTWSKKCGHLNMEHCQKLKGLDPNPDVTSREAQLNDSLNKVELRQATKSNCGDGAKHAC